MTYDIDDALFLADRFVIMSARRGVGIDGIRSFGRLRHTEFVGRLKRLPNLLRYRTVRRRYPLDSGSRFARDAPRR